MQRLHQAGEMVATAKPELEDGAKLLKKQMDLPGADAQRAGRERTGCCKRCVPDDKDTYDLPANYCLVETNLEVYDPLDEYDELATQFAYVSTFTIVIP